MDIAAGEWAYGDPGEKVSVHAAVGRACRDLAARLDALEPAFAADPVAHFVFRSVVSCVVTHGLAMESV